MKKRIMAMMLAVGMLCGSVGENAWAAGETRTVVEQDSVSEVDMEETVEMLGADDFSTATNISIGGTVNDSITETVKNRIYKINLTKSGRLTFDITSYLENYCMFIYDSSGNRIGYWHDKVWNSNLKYRKDTLWIDLTAGNYYIKIDGYRYEYSSSYFSTGTYIFATSFVSADESCVEPNNDFASAAVISLNGTIRGQIAKNDKYDNYKFALTKAGRIKLTLTSYQKYYCLHIYNSEGERIWYSDNNEWNENLEYRTDIYNIDLTQGTYYMKVDGYKWSDNYSSTGNYTMNFQFTDAGVNYTEPNNDFATAHVINTDTAIKGQIALDDRYDILKFTLGKSVDVNLAMLSYMKYYSLYIYDNNGEEVWKDNDNVWNENVGYCQNTHTVTLSAGTYYVKVSGYGWGNTNYASTGIYTLSVNTKSSIVNTTNDTLSDRVYTGKPIKPSVTVMNNGVRLKKGTDYTVSYKNNKKIGTATVVITGKGSFVGTKTLTFKIIPKTAKLTSAKNSGKNTVTLKWKRDKNVSGYEVYRSTNSTTGFKKIKTIKSNKTVRLKKKGNVAGITYYFKVRSYKKVGNKKIRGNFSKVQAVYISR